MPISSFFFSFLLRQYATILTAHCQFATNKSCTETKYKMMKFSLLILIISQFFIKLKKLSQMVLEIYLYYIDGT